MRNLWRLLAFDILAPLAAIAALLAIGVVLDWPLWWVSACSQPGGNPGAETDGWSASLTRAALPSLRDWHQCGKSRGARECSPIFCP